MKTIANWKNHNVSKEVGKYAENLGLECVSTGGGFDFVFRSFGSTAQATLTDECGRSPISLDDRCSVLIHLGDASTPVPWIEFRFKDAREAMKWMKKANPVAIGRPEWSNP